LPRSYVRAATAPAFIGKNHNIADWETSIAGPYDRWPNLQSFGYFYGFIGGARWTNAAGSLSRHYPSSDGGPERRRRRLHAERFPGDAIRFIHQEESTTPERPFFIYYVPGATHDPHHVPKAWIDKFKGQFNQGWDKYREETYQRQLNLGVIPPDTKLPRRPKKIPA
jgi:arylsulfatase A-like enzyme